MLTIGTTAAEALETWAVLDDEPEPVASAPLPPSRRRGVLDELRLCKGGIPPGDQPSI